MSKAPSTRREMDRALTNLNHVLLHLANIKEMLQDGKHDEYIEMIDKLAVSILYHIEMFKEVRQAL